MELSTNINSAARALYRAITALALFLVLCCIGISCSDNKSAKSGVSGQASSAPASPVGRWKIDLNKALQLAESSLRAHPSLAQHSGEQLEMTVAAMRDSLSPSWASGRLTLEAGGKYVATAVNRPQQTGVWKLEGRALTMTADPKSAPWALGRMSFEDGRIQVETPDLKNLVIPYMRDL